MRKESIWLVILAPLLLLLAACDEGEAGGDDAAGTPTEEAVGDSGKNACAPAEEADEQASDSDQLTTPTEGGVEATATEGAVAATEEEAAEPEAPEGDEAAEDAQDDGCPDVSFTQNVEDDAGSDDGGPSNVIHSNNNNDGRFKARGSIDFNRIHGDEVVPHNEAQATASCTDCQTIAVAVQINLYERGASNVSPTNVALAVNENCTRCFTVAWAVQYVIPVDDVDGAHEDVEQLVRDLDREIRYFEKIHSLDEVNLQEAEARLNSVIQNYNDLIEYAEFLQDEARTAGDEEATPTATATEIPAETPTEDGAVDPGAGGGEPTAEPTEQPEDVEPTTGQVEPTPTALYPGGRLRLAA
jgi:hypothetical protein